MTVLSEPSFFWRNSVDLDFFFFRLFYPRKMKFSLSAMWAGGQEKGRGWNRWGSSMCVFDKANWRGWRMKKGWKFRYHWMERTLRLFNYCSLFLCTFIFFFVFFFIFFVFFLGIESTFYIYTSTFKSLNLGLKRLKLGFEVEKEMFLKEISFIEYSCFLFILCLKCWNFNWEILEGDFRIWIYCFASI